MSKHDFPAEEFADRLFIRFLGGRIIGEPENHAIPALE